MARIEPANHEIYAENVLLSSFLKVRFRHRLSSAKICTFGRSYFGSGFAWQKYSNHPITGYVRHCYDTHFFRAPSIHPLSWTNILKEPFDCFVLFANSKRLFILPFKSWVLCPGPAGIECARQ